MHISCTSHYAYKIGNFALTISPFRLTLTLRTADSIPTGSIQTAFTWGQSFTFDLIMELSKIYMRAASPKQMVGSKLPSVLYLRCNTIITIIFDF